MHATKEFTRDRKAPRYRKCIHNVFCKDFITAFKTKFPQYIDIPDDVIKEIIIKYNEQCQKTVTETREGMYLPSNIGVTYIGAFKTKHLNNINYGQSLKYGKTIKNLNFETDGYVGRIIFSSYASKYKFAFRDMWAFTATRTFKEKCSANFKKSYQIFRVTGNIIKANELEEKIRIKDRKERYIKKQLVDYNEFD